MVGIEEETYKRQCDIFVEILRNLNYDGYINRDDYLDGFKNTDDILYQITDFLKNNVNNDKDKKYKMIFERGTSLFRIVALKDFSNIKKGTLGGLIEKGRNLSQRGDCWIGRNAIVTQYAVVKENARVRQNAYISGQAIITGNAQILDDVEISGNVTVKENAIISERVILEDIIKISGNIILSGKSRLPEHIEYTN